MADAAPVPDRYRILFDAIDEGFCIIEVIEDAQGRIDYRFLEVNAAFERYTGLQNAAGARMRDLAPAHEQHWFDIYARIAATGQSERFEQRAEALGFWYDVHAFRVGAPADRRVGILFNDITERKRHEAALRETRARFQALVTAGTYTIYRMSPDWRLMYELDSETLASTSDPIEDWVGKYIPEGDRPEVFAAIQRAIRTKSMFELEHRVLLADGSPGWVLSRAVPLFDADGEITEWFGAGSDVTERRAATERLREREAVQKLLLAELQHRVRNILGVVRSVFRRTVDAGGNSEELADHFIGRLDALARTQVVVTRSASRQVDLEGLIRDELLSVGASDGPDLVIEGPWCGPPPRP